MTTKRLATNLWLFLFLLAFTGRLAGGETGGGESRRIVTAGGVAKTYSDQGRLVLEENATGGMVEYEHDGRGNATVRRQKIADDVWAEWRREFGEDNLLLAEWGPEGGEKRYLRDEDGLTRCVADRVDNDRWSGVFYDYDENGNIVFKSNAVWLSSLDDYLAAKPSAGTSYSYNEDGDLVSITDPMGRTRRFVYNDEGDLLELVTPMEAATRYEYDENGWLVRQIDPVGGITEYAHDDDGNIIAVRAGLNADGEKSFAAYEELAEGEYGWNEKKIVSFTDPTGRTTRYSYNDRGQLIEEIGPGGLKTEAVYDDDGQLLAIFQPDGTKSAFRYDASGRLSAAIDASENRTEYVRDLRGRVSATLYPDGAEERVEWDAAGRVVTQSRKVSEESWQTMRYAYDRRGNTVEIVYPAGTRKTIERDAAGRVVRTVVDPGGLNIVESFAYDISGNLIERIDPLGNATRLDYDADDNLVSMETAEGRKIVFRYDAAGRLMETVTDPDGEALRQTYDIDPRGRLAASHNGLSGTRYGYDEAGRLIEEMRPGRAALSYGHDAAGRTSRLVRRDGKEEIAVSARYDALGRTLERVDAAGNRIEFQYNVNGQLTGVIGPSGSRVSLEWDKGGRLRELSLPENRRYRYTYDLNGNLVRAEGGPSGAVEYRYNAAGQRAAATDANGRERRLDYDAAGRLIRTVDQMGHTVTFTHDAAGNVLSMTDANGNTTRYAYDRDGLRTAITYPAVDGAPENVVRYRYDGAGRLSGKTTPNGETVSYRYGAGGRIAAAYTGDPLPPDQDIPANRLLTRYERDETGAIVREIISEGGLEFEYDAFGRLRRSRDLEMDRSVEYEYDRRNRRTRMRILEHSRHGDRTAAEVRYTYDRSGRMTSVRHDDEAPTRYFYDTAGRRTRLELPNGIVTDYVYNGLDRVAEMRTTRAGELISSFSYTYDAAGNRTAVAMADGSRIDYTLDPGYRLAAERRLAADGTPLYEERFAYDPAGNRLSRESTLSGPASYVYNARNQLTHLSDRDGGIVYRYDANGNLVAEEGAQATAYGYDALDRLIRYEGPDGTEETGYYGGLWRRRATRLTQPDGETVELRHLHDLDDITGDFRVGPDGRTRLSRVYVTPFLDDNLSMAEYGDLDRQYFYFLRDGLGSVSAVTDAAGRVRSRYDYTAFGEDYVPDEAEEVLQRFGYTGRERSGASPLLSYRFRQYNPALGRFSQRDPAGTAGGVNLYGYVENQPYRFVDPYGLWLTDTHVAIQIQAIREEFGLECDPKNGACPSVSALFKGAHAFIDNSLTFITNPGAHALTTSGTVEHPKITEMFGPDIYDYIERERVQNLIETWNKSIDNFNKNFLTSLGMNRKIGDRMRETGVTQSKMREYQEKARNSYRENALRELSYGQHAVADASIHDFQTWIGEHWKLEWSYDTRNPMANAETRIDKYVTDNKGQLPLNRDNPGENTQIGQDIPALPDKRIMGKYWDDNYGGYDAMVEKYSNENIQEMLNQAIDASRKHLRGLNESTNGDLRSLLIESGCKEDDGLRREQ